MRSWKRYFVWLPLLCLLLAGCSGAADQSAERTLFAMDTVMELKAEGANAGKAVAAAVKRITELEKLLSVTLETSEI